jgi:hypothetical protein
MAGVVPDEPADHPRRSAGRCRRFTARCVNIQRGKDGNAKAYQVRQVLDAIARLDGEKNEKYEEGDDDA